MKQFFILLTAIFSLAGCKKNDDRVFDKLPEERMSERNAELRDKLLGSPNGWKGYLKTSYKGGGYAFYIKFNADETLSMMADLNNTSATVPNTSTFRIKYVMNTSLIFDTYNYLGLLQDPTPAAYGGAAGTGYKSDIEFDYLRSNGDSVILKGKKYLNILTLVKASASDETSFNNGGYLTAINKFKGFFAGASPYVLLNNAGTEKKLELFTSNNDKTLSGMYTAPGQTATTVTTGFAYGIDGAYLADGLVIDGIRFTGLKWKDATTLVMYDDKGKEYPVQRAEIPVKTIIETRNPVLTIADATTFPGWGNDFVTRRATANTYIVATYTNGTVPIRLGQMLLQDFNNTAKTFLIKIYTPRIDGVAVSYTINLNYKYSFVNDNVIKFTFVSANAGFDAGFYNNGMPALLIQRLNVDTFKMDYFSDTVSGNLYIRFTSVEHPDFVFTTSF